MKKISIKYRILLIIFFIQIPFLVLFRIYMMYTVGNINLQLAKGYSEALSVFCNAISTQLSNVDTFLGVDCWADASFRGVSLADSADEARSRLVPVLEKAEILLDNNVDISAVSLDFPRREVNCLLFSPHTTYTEADEIRLKDLLQEIHTDFSGINTAWVLHTGTGRPYMVRSFQYDGVYCTVMIDFWRLAGRSQTYYKMSTPVVFVKGEELVSEAYWTRSLQEGLPGGNSKEPYYLVTSGEREYLVVSEQIMTMTALYGVQYNYSWDWLNVAIYGFIGVTVACFLLAWLSLHLTFFKPLKRLLGVMDSIRTGDLSARANDFKSSEFTYINETFNGMLDTIENLKIETYENQLLAKTSQMNALRLQIRRHFFLNCLKNIYAMARSGNVKDIQQAVLLLSGHLRYTLDISRDAVDLTTEIKMCQNYMELQGVGQEQKPELEVHIEDELELFRVPPISLLTLLENCCKYGMALDKALHVVIGVSLRKLDDEKFVNLVVQDNGLGFSEEMLPVLNSRMGNLTKEGHVGITNVIARFRMLYGEECSIIFANSDGASIELIIPLDEHSYGDVV